LPASFINVCDDANTEKCIKDDEMINVNVPASVSESVLEKTCMIPTLTPVVSHNFIDTNFT